MKFVLPPLGTGTMLIGEMVPCMPAMAETNHIVGAKFAWMSRGWVMYSLRGFIVSLPDDTSPDQLTK